MNEIKSTGFLVDTLEATLWVFFTTDGFEQEALKVANLGDDADTVGAVLWRVGGRFLWARAIATGMVGWRGEKRFGR